MEVKDKFRDDLKEMVEFKHRQEREKIMVAAHTKAKESKLQEDMTRYCNELESLQEENEKNVKNLKQLMMENSKLKQRIIKIKLKKGKIDKDIKMCRKCSKEYSDKENFNWSCRTHQYEYSGEMWWCCGKRGIHQLGCSYAKHESKEDEDDED